jgi:hypothetical protein
MNRISRVKKGRKQMSRFYTHFTILFTCLFLSSCTIHHGQLIDLNYGQFVPVTQQAVGAASVSYFLGIGGNKTTVLIKEAKDDLIRNRPLKPNEKYANQCLNVSTTYFLCYTKQRVTITADIISEGRVDSSLIQASLKKRENQLFNIGDSLATKKLKFKGVLLNQVVNLQARVRDRKQRIKYLDLDVKDIFRINGSYRGFSIGEEVYSKTNNYARGRIVGFGAEHVLVQDKDEYLCI